mmetsp:Transcript_5913/g.8968  ORF Transcript_5913/g.8968 Transcript_5913/m.8968 type:complete len:99 (+) Transcript_5913:170-466(+)
MRDIASLIAATTSKPYSSAALPAGGFNRYTTGFHTVYVTTFRLNANPNNTMASDNYSSIHFNQISLIVYADHNALKFYIKNPSAAMYMYVIGGHRINY